jgi:hypothetical protein
MCSFCIRPRHIIFTVLTGLFSKAGQPGWHRADATFHLQLAPVPVHGIAVKGYFHAK